MLSDRRPDLPELAAPGSTVPQLAAAPAGWSPGVLYEPDGTRVVTLPPGVKLGEADYAGALADLGIDVPDGYRIRLAALTFDPAAWHRDEQGEDAVTRPIWRHRFVVEVAPASVNVDELFRLVKPRKPRTSKGAGTATFVSATADTQLGDGNTADVIQRFYDMNAAAMDRCKALRKRGIVGDRIGLPWLGDCIQNINTSAPAAKNDLSVVEQVRIYRRLLLWQVQEWSRIGEIQAAVVPGNHDMAARNGRDNAFPADHSWAIEGAVAVADALAMHDGYDHVGWVFPRPGEATVTLDWSGTVVAMAHGHQWRGEAAKAHAWWKGQAHGRTGVGAADVLLTGHRHHFFAEVAGGNRLAVVCPPLVDTDAYWTELAGDRTPPGLLTMVVADGGWSHLEIL